MEAPRLNPLIRRKHHENEEQLAIRNGDEGTVWALTTFQDVNCNVVLQTFSPDKRDNIIYIFVSATYKNNSGTNMKRILIQTDDPVGITWFQPLFTNKIYAYRFTIRVMQDTEQSIRSYVEPLKVHEGQWTEARPNRDTDKRRHQNLNPVTRNIRKFAKEKTEA